MTNEVADFLIFLEKEQNFSLNTIKSYHQDIALFFCFLKKENINYLHIKQNDIRNYLKYLDNKNLKNSTIARNISALRSFYNYLLSLNKIELNLFKGIRNPKIEKHLPNYLGYEELAKILDNIDITSSKGKRNRLIVELLYATGMRVGELANIKKKDINKDNKTIRIMGKGSKERIVYYGDYAKYYLDLDTQKWNDTYTMSSVTGISNGKYAIINDVQGKNLRLYSTDGLEFSAQTDGNIVSCALNSQGTSAVIQKYGEDYKISVIRNDGQVLMERFEQDSGIYPLSAALSEDSKILSVTYADTTDVEIKAKVLLFYVNKEDSKNTATGEFYAGIEKENIIAPYIFALDGNFVIVYDKGLFAIDSSGNEIWNTPIYNRIDAVAHTQNGSIVLSLGDQLAGTDGFESGTVYILNKNGKEKSEYFIGEDISYLNVAGKDIIIGSGNDFICINESAKENWRFTATQVVKDVFPYTGGNKVLVITGTEAKIIEAE